MPTIMKVSPTGKEGGGPGAVVKKLPAWEVCSGIQASRKQYASFLLTRRDYVF